MNKLKLLFYLLFIFLSNCKEHSNYSGDEKGDTLFYQNFEYCENGKQSVWQVKQSWKNQSYLWGFKDRTLFFLGRKGSSPEIINQSNKYIKITIPKNTSGPIPGCQWASKLDNKFDELTLEFKVMFDSNFCFVKGGKLPGLAGGFANTGGVKPNGVDGWSARMMFWEKGKLCFWIYHKNQPGKFGDSLFFAKNGNYFSFVPGKWYTIKQHVKMNLIGQKNGIVEGYIDGELWAKRSDIEFRTSEILAIDQLIFSVFLGGDEKEYESSKDEIIYLDDFVLCR